MSDPIIKNANNNNITDFESMQNLGAAADKFKQDPKMLKIFQESDTNKNNKLDINEVSLFTQKSKAVAEQESKAPFLPKEPDFGFKPQSGAQRAVTANAVQQAKPKTQAQVFNEQGKRIATNMNEEIEDNFTLGGTDTPEFKKALSQITPNNVMQLIANYEKISDGNTVITDINGEYSDSEDDRKAAVTTIMDNLFKKAEMSGVDKNNLQTLKNNFNQSLRTQYRQVGTVNSDDMNQIMNGVIQSINNVSSLSKSEKADITTQKGSEQRRQTAGFLTNKANEASRAFQAQKDYDGWIGKMVDSMSVAWGSDNRASIVARDIQTYQSQINTLKQADEKGSAEFDAQFYKTFGVEFDPIQAAAYKKKEAQYTKVLAAHGTEVQFNSQMKNLMASTKLSEEYQTHSSTYGNTMTVVTATKADVFNREVKNFAQFMGAGDEKQGMQLVNQAWKNAGLNPQKASMEEKYTVLSNSAKQISTALHKNTMKESGNKDFAEVNKEYNASYTATFGTKNDIAKRVSKYNASQQAGTGIAKATIITIGATVIGTLTGGAGVAPVLAAAGGTTALSAGVSMSDRISSNNGLSAEEAKKIIGDSLIDGATMIGSGFTQVATTTANISKGTAFAIRTATDTALDMGAEYLQNGEITLTNTIISAVASAGGQVAENVMEANALNKELDTGVRTNLPDQNSGWLGDTQSGHNVTHQPATDKTNPAQTAEFTRRVEEKIKELNLDTKTEITMDDLATLGIKLDVTASTQVLSDPTKYIDGLLEIPKPPSVTMNEALDQIAVAPSGITIMTEADLQASMSPLGKGDWSTAHKHQMTVADQYRAGHLRDTNPVNIAEARYNTAATVIGKPVDPQILETRNYDVNTNSHTERMLTAESTNEWWAKKMGYDNPPYTEGSNAQIVVLDKETTFVRTFDVDGSGAFGGWVMNKNDLMTPDGKMMTPAQIKDRYALPTEPQFMCDVTMPAGTVLRTGTCNPLEGWGKGGGQQYDLIGQRVGQFDNPRYLPGVGENVEAAKKALEQQRNLLQSQGFNTEF